MTLRSVGSNNKLQEETITFAQDEGKSRDNARHFRKLRPAFNVRGSVTAGNSSQMSDGAASVLLMDREKAVSDGMKPLAKFRSFAVAGVPPEVMGIGPIGAIPKALKLAGLELSDIGLFELNEAFASQSIQVIRELGLDEEKVNVNGGAIALGHPLGCTGAKLTLSLIHEMKRRNEQFGIVTMCIGGGMGRREYLNYYKKVQVACSEQEGVGSLDEEALLPHRKGETTDCFSHWNWIIKNGSNKGL